MSFSLVINLSILVFNFCNVIVGAILTTNYYLLFKFRYSYSA